jgi:hypothetical protein
VGLSVRLWISKSLEGLLRPVLWKDKGLHGCFVRSVGVRQSLESRPGKIHGATVVKEGTRSTPSSCCLCGLQEGRGEGALSGLFFFFFFFASQCSPDLLSLGPSLSTFYLLSFLLSFYTS